MLKATDKFRAIAHATLIILVLFVSACRREGQKEQAASHIQELPLTFGGFIKDHPERGKLEGVCGTDFTRNTLNCDIYNGLMDWTITEVTIVVTWSPYGDGDKRYYRTPIHIEPFLTEPSTVRLGLQLPPDEYLHYRARTYPPIRHWGWNIVGAKGYPVK